MTATARRARAAQPLELVITRRFEAPRELVFEAWTRAEHLARWWAPQDCTLLSCEVDVRPGGAWYRRMRSRDGREHVKRGVYREIAAPERLVFTYLNEAADGSCGPEMLVTVTFEEDAGGTRLTLRQTGFEAPAERDAHTGGWTSALGGLANYLAEAGVAGRRG